MFNGLVSFIFQLKEGLLFAVESILSNKLRTFLSLFGITIGIFSIISVFTVLDTLENTVRNNMNSLGSDMVYVQKWPWGPEDGSNEYQWWKFMNRPEASFNEYEDIERISNMSNHSCFMISRDKMLENGKNYFSAEVVGCTYNFWSMRNMELQEGRYFTPFEVKNGSKVILLGSKVAEELFGGTDPLNKQIKVGGKRATVIGVIKKEGDNMFGNSSDEWGVVPFNFAKSMMVERYSNPTIMVKAKDGISADELASELTALMRQLRRLSPKADENFAINRLSLVTGKLDQIFSTINLAGGIIGIFAIIVGGFGIANIMFVSVRERIKQIGVQKALGAKSYVILMLFMYESIFLSIIGGIFGLILIYGGTEIINHTTEFTVELTLKNISIGLFISAFVGAASGFFPAYQASKMEPVEAIFKNV